MTKEELDELKLQLESNVFPDNGGMFCIMINILAKCSDNLYEAEDFYKYFSPYVLCKYLSMREDLMPYGEYLSTVFSTAKLTNLQFYKLAYQLIPKKKFLFIKYLKSQKEEKIENNRINNKNDILTNLMEL